MAMRVYLTRHGQTEWNVRNQVLGRTDVPLNETGLAQARELARSLEGEPIDLVITSPLTRTVQTGKCIAERLGVPAVTSDALIEMDFGVFEGVQRDDPAYQAEKKRYFARLAGGESYLDLAGRAYPFLKSLPELVPQILAEQRGASGAGRDAAGAEGFGAGRSELPVRDRLRDPNVLLVSHNGICRVICSYFQDMENDAFRNFQLDNCRVLQFEL